MDNMRSGTLRHKILIEKTTESRDSFGGVTNSWSTHATLRARQAIHAGREFIAAQQKYSELSALYIGRYTSGVTAKMRVNHGGVYYDILAAYDPTGTGRELQIACKLQQ